jgi:hypothetical protein
MRKVLLTLAGGEVGARSLQVLAVLLLMWKASNQSLSLSAKGGRASALK